MSNMFDVLYARNGLFMCLYVSMSILASRTKCCYHVECKREVSISSGCFGWSTRVYFHFAPLMRAFSAERPPEMRSENASLSGV